MEKVTFRTSEERDLKALVAALTSLARDLGDPYRAPDAALGQALFGPCPSASARLAEREQKLAGVTLFSPVFSTAQGCAGVYVSDLWVDPAWRGQGLGQALLRDAVGCAAELWHAGFLRLVVHDANAAAMAFYRRLGFAPAAGQTTLALTGAAYNALGDRDESHS